MRLADYAGRWLVLFSHPADFTPVCTTEFVAFTELADEFAARDTALLGNSVDSVHSHLARTCAIEEKLGVRIPFPIIADLDMRAEGFAGSALARSLCAAPRPAAVRHSSRGRCSRRAPAVAARSST